MPEDSNDDTKTDTVLSRKLKKVLDSKLESDADTLDALKELSTFFKENNLQNRRNLRGEIERRNLQITNDFLTAFQVVKDRLDQVDKNVTGMSKSCANMQARLSASKTVTSELMRKTTEVQSRSKTLQLQAEIAEKWRDRLTLSQEDREVLQSRSLHDQHKISPEFFQVLDKVAKIKSDCQVLLSAGHQTAALTTMDQMSDLEESAIERLYRWAQATVRNTELTDGALVQLGQAMRHLQHRESLFQHVIDEYINSRRAALVRGFIEALTVGGPGGAPRPIEMHAHEPTRYVGDMLAWLHQSCPGEQESVQHLLKFCDQVNKHELESKIMTGATEGVCRPLKSRVEQILMSEASPVTLYRLTNLIRFYLSTMANVVKADSCLSLTLTELSQWSHSQFMTMLQSSVAAHLARMEGGGDLSPSPATTSLLGLLRDVMSGAGHSVVDENKDDLEKIIGCVCDPLTHQLQTTADSLPSQDGAVFLINNLHQLRTTLSLYRTPESRLSSLSTMIDSSLGILSSHQTNHLLSALGLLNIQPLLIPGGDGTPLSTVPGCHPAAVSSISSRLDSWLAAPDLLLLPPTRLLISSGHRRHVTQESHKQLAVVYSQLYAAVTTVSNGYEAGTLNKTPDQISQLLQL